MIDMDVGSDCISASSDDYNTSPCIYLSEAQCKALGITTPPAAGVAMTITARAVAQSVTQSVDDDADDPDTRMTLMLTHLEISAAPSSKASLYD